MKVYSYDPITCEFIGTDTAERDPVEKGNWLIPRNAVRTKPPATKANEVARWNIVTEAWERVVDRRGEQYFYRDEQNRIAQREITSLGEIPPAGSFASRDEVPNTPEESASIARYQRTALLAEADIVINKLDDTGQDASAWRAYRQALRDVTKQDGFPETFVWPVKPE